MTHDSALRTIARNYPRGDEWDDGSIVGVVTEYCRWNYDEYWALESALYRLTAADSPEKSSLAGRMFLIYVRLTTSLRCHFDPQDVVRIENLADAEIREVLERISLVFQGYFEGEMPAPSSFSAVNPLLPAPVA